MTVPASTPSLGSDQAHAEGCRSPWTQPTPAAIKQAQAAYDRGEVTLLEATFLADALSDESEQT